MRSTGKSASILVGNPAAGILSSVSATPALEAVRIDRTRSASYSVPMSTHITPAQFIAKWSRVELPERSASQEHFIDLCRMLGQPTPAEFDATGAEYTFEKGASVTGPASRSCDGRTSRIVPHESARSLGTCV